MKGFKKKGSDFGLSPVTRGVGRDLAPGPPEESRPRQNQESQLNPEILWGLELATGDFPATAL